MACLVLVAGTLAMTAGGAGAQPGSAGAQQGSAGAQPEPRDMAGCPVATPAQAGASTVGAPTRVRAIPGDGSVTVTWCPPVLGQDSVASYTVTSSSGQQTTARVPNAWDIVDGLTNGQAYSFTITANTLAGGSGAVSSASNQATPAPIRPPSNVLLGKPAAVSYDQYSLMIGGQRRVIYAGEMDPWRLASPSLWLDRLQKMKADGYNAVTAYFNWDYTSAAPGVYDFSGVRDMNEFLNMAQEAGLYVIARPGPYINAETDGGGIPSWVLTLPGGFRTDSAPYMSAALQWYSEIDPIIAAHQITKGGDVILDQIENEYTDGSADGQTYMADLEAQARADGITVPFTFNTVGGATFSSGTGAVNITGEDSYPQGACTSPNPNFDPSSGYPSYPGEPQFIPEMQDGSWDGWGGTGYAACYPLAGPDYDSVYYKDNLAQGVTMQSNYMAVGGTNWGWLPTNFVYTSYDYGSGIQETGEIGTPSNPNNIAGSKYGENKLIGDFEQSAAPLAQTVPATAPAVTNSAVVAVARVNPDDGTQFSYVRQADASSTATVSTHLDLSASYPSVPQQPGTALTLVGRDAKMLIAGYSFGGQYLVYSTSELMTQARIGSDAVAVFYGDKGTDGETVLRYASQPSVHVLSGTAQVTWDAAAGDLRLDYVHSGLTEVSVTGGGRPPLLLLLATTDVAEQFWPAATAAGSVLVEGGYLVRTAAIHGRTLALTGDTSTAGPVTVWAPPGVTRLTWNGRPLATAFGDDGSLTGTVPGPVAVILPDLTNWRFSYETPETQPGFDDSSWALADHPVTTTGATPSSGQPVLSAGDYGFNHGFVWYRGHFIGGSGETGITLTADGVEPTGAFSVWLNGAFLGSNTGGGPQTQTFAFPPGAITAGKDNVVAVLVENTGHPEGPSSEPVGLYSASLDGSAAPITWRLEGNAGGMDLQDPVRGVMNATGLDGTNNGWDLPGYPDGDWQPVTLPDNWASRGLPPGIGWYSTTFNLGLPHDGYVPVAVQIGPPGPGAQSASERAFIFVNGWLVGRYVADEGPQHQFYVPAGILNQDGNNTLAIAVWGLDATGGGLQQVKLAAMGDQAGGDPVHPVASPGYDPRIYGPPSTPQPTLGVEASRTLVESGQSFTAKAVLSDLGSQPLDNAAVSLTAPAGWTITPAGSQPLGSVRPGSSASATFTVTPPSAGLAAGTDDLLARATYADGGIGQTLLSATQLQVPYSSLAATYDNTAVTSNSDPNPSPGFIGFDGGGTSYSADDLAGEGLTPGAAVSAGGMSFTWPSSAPGALDNTMAEGQTIALSGQGSSLGFILATDDSPLSGTGTIYYTDGTTSTYALGSGNFWFASGASGNPVQTQVASVGANYTTGSAGHTVYIFETSIPLDASKTVEAITLPSLGNVAGKNPALHIFAMSVGTAAPSLTATFDNAGITDDNDPNPNPGFIGFDDSGTSYSAEGLAAAGLTPGATLAADGMSFTWPDAAAGQPDNTMAEGQTIALSGQGSALGFVLAANNAPVSGTGTIYYTDGTTSTYTLGSGNFWNPAGASGNPAQTQVAAVAANYPTGSAGHTVYVFATTVPVDTSKTVEAVALPPLNSVVGHNAALHIFAMTLATPTA
jgi:beta-galactosidase GanA